MKIKYNRVSTLVQTGNRFSDDKENYDLTLLDKVSGNVDFKDRPQAKKLIKLIEQNKVSEIVIEEFSRIGRNTIDVINTLDWLDKKEINVFVRNLGLHSRPNGIRNPLWRMFSSVMASIYEMELENIKERTAVGRAIYLQNGGILGRPTGTNETKKAFLEKEDSKKIIKHLNTNKYTIRQIAKLCDVSTSTVVKVKNALTT